jgi:hypothetical protein
MNLKNLTLSAAALMLLVSSSAGEAFAQRPPLQVRFELGDDPEAKELILETGRSAQIALVLEPHPAGLPTENLKAECELILRLPVGIALQSSGWRSIELPEEEKKLEGESIWSLYELEEPVQVNLTKNSDQPLAKLPLTLGIVEEGINWIITSQAQVKIGTDAAQILAVLFATWQGETAKFHTQPERP